MVPQGVEEPIICQLPVVLNPETNQCEPPQLPPANPVAEAPVDENGGGDNGGDEGGGDNGGDEGGGDNGGDEGGGDNGGDADKLKNDKLYCSMLFWIHVDISSNTASNILSKVVNTMQIVVKQRH